MHGRNGDELSCRPGGLAGLNFALRPSVNNSVEVDARARLGGGLLTAALFRTQTADEIMTATNVNGRATFTNGGRTQRGGMELGWLHETPGHWRTQVAYTWLDASYRASGDRIPGIGAGASLISSASTEPTRGAS